MIPILPVLSKSNTGARNRVLSNMFTLFVHVLSVPSYQSFSHVCIFADAAIVRLPTFRRNSWPARAVLATSSMPPPWTEAYSDVDFNFYSVLERRSIDIEKQRSIDQKCFELSKAITRSLRHDQSVPRGIDGAIHYNDIIEECRRKKFDDASQGLLEDWRSKLAKERRKYSKIVSLQTPTTNS